MNETVFSVSPELIAAVLAASAFVADCLRQEAAVRVEAIRKEKR
jgi:hypothetical protein